jgi:quercetin dioxygenase-like cupin family protein
MALSSSSRRNSRNRKYVTKRYSHIAVAFFSGWMLGIIYHRQFSSTIDPFLESSDSATGTTVPTMSSSTEFRPKLSSFVTHLSNISTRATSHVDPQHDDEPITKQQLIEPMVIPNVAGFSVATIPRGHEVTLHHHATMHEFFYVLEGSATFTIIHTHLLQPPPDGDDNRKKGNIGNQFARQLQQQQFNYTVQPGSFVYLAPPDRHAIHVAADSPHGDVKLMVAGIIVE